MLTVHAFSSAWFSVHRCTLIKARYGSEFVNLTVYYGFGQKVHIFVKEGWFQTQPKTSSFACHLHFLHFEKPNQPEARENTMAVFKITYCVGTFILYGWIFYIFIHSIIWNYICHVVIVMFLPPSAIYNSSSVTSWDSVVSYSDTGQLSEFFKNLILAADKLAQLLVKTSSLTKNVPHHEHRQEK